MILATRRIAARPLPKADGMKAIGLRYERQVIRALCARNIIHEHNPWFEYTTTENMAVHVAVPDAMLFLDKDSVIVAEIKLKFVPDAMTKLEEIYCPIVSKHMGKPVRPLIIVKSLTLDTPSHSDSISEALKCQYPIYHWLGHARIVL